MDFWDLTKLLMRRWAVALPMLLLSAAITAAVVAQVNPNYIATAYVQLVPPVPQPAKPGQAAPEQRNPWLGDLQTIGNAAAVTVRDQTVIEEMKAAGYSDSFTVEMGSSSPMVSFEVIGQSLQQARATADQLVRRYIQSVTALQEDYGVASADLISTRRLDLGTNVTESDSKIKRALVAVAAAGLLMTVAVTVAVDAWSRRRSRRRDDVDAAAPTSPVSGGASPMPPAGGSPTPAAAGSPTPVAGGSPTPVAGGSPTPAVNAPTPATDDDRTIAIRQASKGRLFGGGSRVGVTDGGNEPTTRVSVRRLYGRGRSGPGDAKDADQTRQVRDMPEDGTIVLPAIRPGKER